MSLIKHEKRYRGHEEVVNDNRVLLYFSSGILDLSIFS